MIEKKINLNKEQEKAVNHTEGPLLIVAGAGTGKTKVLIDRLAKLVETKSASPDEVLLLTFTEKAASEMEDRALKILPYGYVDLWINTFHGFCERVLKEHALDIGLDLGFRLLSQTEQWILIRKNLDKFELEYYKPLGNPDKFIYELVKHFSRLKDENITPLEYLEYAEKLNKKTLKAASIEMDEEKIEASRISELAKAYEIYNKLILDGGFLDFGDLINYTITLFKKRPNILKYYQKKFKYIMIDEFQDTNWAQYELIKILTGGEKNKKCNLMVVGDDDQAIYKFRGASLSNIMQFKDDFPEAKEIVLTQNYRSTQKILDTAYSFIKHNDPNRLEKKLKIKKELKSNINDDGAVEFLNFADESGQVEWIANNISSIYKKNKGTKWSDFAILVRANSSAEKFTDELNKKNIPNLFYSLKGLYNKPIIMDVLAYLRLLDNYHESAAVYRVLNMEIFKVDHADIVNINKYARKKVWSIFESLTNINSIPNIQKGTIEKVERLLHLIGKHSISIKKEKPSTVFLEFINDSEILKSKDHDVDREFFSFLNQFYKKIKSFEELIGEPRVKDFLEVMDMEVEAGETGSLKLDFEDEDVVKIMTVHAAKGLEFEYVYLPDLVDKRFPTISRKEKIAIPDEIVREKLPESENIHIEEERRLFYVALTRAKSNLFLTAAKNYGGSREKKISSFVNEAGMKFSDEIRADKENKLRKDLVELNNKKEKSISSISFPTRFSFSQIEAYSNCPLQYKFNFILKIPVPSKPNFIFGRVIHDTLRDFLLPTINIDWKQPQLFNKKEKEKNPDLKKLLEIYKKNWVPDGYDSKKSRDEYKEKGKNIMINFFGNIENEGWPDVIFLEKSFVIKIGGFVLRGAIDRVDRLEDGTVELIDYKTGNPKEKLDYSSKRQLILYKIVMEEGFGLKVSKLSFYYLENGKKLTFSANDKDVEKLKNSIADTIKEIKSGNFKEKPGILCRYCDFNSICEFREM